MFELNPEQLTHRLAAVRDSIHARLEALGDYPANARERKALRGALEVFDIVLEIESIRSPDLTANISQNFRPAA